MRKYFFKYLKNYNLNKKFEFVKLKTKILNFYFYNVKIFCLKNLNKIFCVETGRKRSVLSFFFLNRMVLKKNLSLLKINGIKKVS